MEIVLLKEQSNELYVFPILQSESKLEKFKEPLVEGLRVHLIKLVSF